MTVPCRCPFVTAHHQLMAIERGAIWLGLFTGVFAAGMAASQGAYAGWSAVAWLAGASLTGGMLGWMMARLVRVTIGRARSDLTTRHTSSPGDETSMPTD